MGILQNSIYQELLALKAEKKLILFAPTFRDQEAGTAMGFTRAELESLNSLLAQRNTLLAIRPHPRECDAYAGLTDGLSHVLMAASTRWKDVNAIMLAADALITDYSSLWIEYLLLNRPLLGYLWDVEEYRHGRGFLVDIEKVFPGRKSYHFNELQTHIDKLIQADFQLSQQDFAVMAYARELFHQSIDGNNSARIAALVKNHPH